MSAGDRDLAATHALGALPPDEEATVEQELARNAVLASEVEEYRGVVETLDSGIARDAPPPGLFDVVLSRIEAERSAELPAPGRPSDRHGNDEATRQLPRRSEESNRPVRSGFRRRGSGCRDRRCGFLRYRPRTPDARAAVRGTPESRPSTVMHSSIRRARRTVSSSSTSTTCHPRPRTNRTHAGTAAIGCPAKRSSAIFPLGSTVTHGFG